MKLRLTGPTAGLAVGITVVVAAASAAGAYLYSIHHFEELLGSARATAVAQGALISAALEHEMIENDRTLIRQMVESFGRQPQVANVMLLDRQGTARFSSGRLANVTDLSIDSPTCQACHRLPPEQRASSRVLEANGGMVLRTVVPFRNREACHRCHDPTHAINGILLVDMDVGELRASMNEDLRRMVTTSGILTLLLVGSIGGIVRVVVMRRLQRFETTARLIAGGDLGRRVPARGSDTISWLAREFNTMADSMGHLIGEVRQQRERLETVINSIDDGIVVLDPERRIVAANTAFLRRTGQERSEVLGCCCREVMSGTCTGSDCPTLAGLRQGGRQVRICERRSEDGSISWEEVHASPIVGPEGDLLQVVEVWRDISERRAAEARLAESHRLASLGVLASGFSHELNTPLATVLAAVEGILRDASGATANVDAARLTEIGTIARDQVLRCRAITQHFLRLSRGQSSTGEIVDLDEVVAAVVRLVTPTARDHSVAMHVEREATGARVHVDEGELQHALVNLLLNGIQACPPGGRIAVHVAANHVACIRVTDNGHGIAPEHQSRIFEPFFSLRQGGTGLGLFLSLTFVRRWGGDIRVDSVPGQGATFEVSLPLAANDTRPRDPRQHAL